MTTLFGPGDVINDIFKVFDVKHGGMGTIYLCRRLDIPFDMALKTIREVYLTDPGVRKHVLQETEVWVELGRHPNIVRCWAAEFIRSQLFLFLELVEGVPGMGVDLRSWVSDGPLDPTDSINITVQICLGMKYAQEQVPGIVHRDLKPGNILMSKDGTAKVTDFGLVAALGSSDGEIAGTPPYMSPEQCRGDAVDIRSDIYSVGCILFEMLTGQWVFAVRSLDAFIHCHLHEEPRPLRAVDGRLPAELEHIISRCLQKDIEARYQDWASLIEDLCEAFEAIEGRPFRFKALEPDPAAVEFLRRLDLRLKALTYRQIGRVQEALDIVQQLIASGETPWHDEAVGLYHEEGACLCALGKYREAEASFKRALELEPAGDSVWHDLSVCHKDQGRITEFLSCNQRALELNPREPDYWNERGHTLSELGREQEAVECFRRAVELDPTDEKACTNVGVCLSNLGELQEALVYQERATRLAPAFAQAWGNRGDTHTKLEQYEEALACYDKALALDPSLSGAWAMKGQVQAQLGQLAEALVSLDKALELNSEVPEVWAARGQVQAHLDQPAKALVSLDRALTLDPDLQVAWRARGQVQAVLGKLKEALVSFDRAIELAPDSADAWLAKARVQFRLNKPREAMSSLSKAVETDPKLLGRVLDDLGEVLEIEPAVVRYLLSSSGEPDDDLAHLHKALRLAPTSSTILLEVAVALNRLGRHQEALTYIECAVEVAPDDALVWYNKGVICAALGLFEDSLECYNRSVRLDSHDSDVWYDRGLVLIHLERYEEALLSFDQVTKLDPMYGPAYADRGVVYAILQRYDEALADYSQAIRIDPSLTRVYINIGVLLGNQGRWREALHYFDKAFELGEPRAAEYVTLARRELGIEVGPGIDPDQFGRALEAFLTADSLEEMRLMVAEFPFITNLASTEAMAQFAALQIPPDFKRTFERHLTWLRQIADEQE